MCLMAAVVPHRPSKYFHVTASNGIVSSSPYTQLAIMTASPIASVRVSPGAAIERAQGLWKILGHTGAVALSCTGDPATGDFSDATVLREFGDVPDDLSAL
jgi:hypothetical protein